ncbi:MAG: class II aldolase/adducin family protein [Chloroflexota bacterium]
MDDRALRDAVVAGGARLGARGLIAAAEGNLSVRLPGDRILITPGGRRKDALEPGELLVVPLGEPATSDDAGPSGLRPSSDLAIHRAIYAARPDVEAVVHAHVPAAMALTLAGQAPDPARLPETALLLPRLPVVPFGVPGSPELAARVAAAFVEGDPRPAAVLLELHGAVAVGAGIAETVDRMELVDVLCRVWRDAALLRAAQPGREGAR